MPAVGDEGNGIANGTFGELLQGTLPRSRSRFLVTLPIDAWSTAAFRPSAATGEVTVSPAHKQKSLWLAVRMLRAYGYQGGGDLTVDSEIPEGKGLASSSADLVAVARAVTDALGQAAEESQIEYFLRGVEPSDGVMYPGTVSYYHREVRLREQLGFLPPMSILAHDEGGAVDTIQFNRTTRSAGLRDRREYGHLLADLGQAIRAGDRATIGRVATRSTELHARRHPRPCLEPLRRVCREVGGLGVVIAHSGTVCGVLMAGSDVAAELLDEFRDRVLAVGLTGAVRAWRVLGQADYDSPVPSGRPVGLIGGESAL